VRIRSKGSVEKIPALIVAFSLVLAGCGTGTLSRALKDPENRVADIDRNNLESVSDFYLPYAVLAADAYRRPNAREERLAVLTQNREKAGKDDDTNKKQDCKDYEIKTTISINSPYVYGGCEPFDDAWPVKPEDCEDKQTGNVPPTEVNNSSVLAQRCEERSSIRVPLTEVAKNKCWERALEIEKHAPIKEWSVFVPDLSIEVWRRGGKKAKCDGEREYAIVFRGTVAGFGSVF
jgi:hypothetical protein